MATFISTIQFTDQGLKNISTTCQRAAAFKTSAASMGIEVKDLFWTSGQFDGLIVFDAPDDETAMAATLQLNSIGNVQIQTVRAYQSEEMEQILSKPSDFA